MCVYIYIYTHIHIWQPSWGARNDSNSNAGRLGQPQRRCITAWEIVAVHMVSSHNFNKFQIEGPEPQTHCMWNGVSNAMACCWPPVSTFKSVLARSHICSMSCTVSSHNLDSHNFRLRVSNPRPIACLHLNMPFESSNLQGAGPIFPDWAFENWPQATIYSALRIHGTHQKDLRFAWSYVVSCWTCKIAYKGVPQSMRTYFEAMLRQQQTTIPAIY